ncbi:MAG: hypothetical protein R3B94_08610 [Hyphomonas sp.]
MAEIDFVKEHFQVLKTCSHDDRRSIDDSGGKYAFRFAEGLPHVDANKLPDRFVSRTDVLGYVADPSFNTQTVAAAIMAWGGMHMEHRKALFHSEDTRWARVCDRIRNGTLERKAAYEAFATLRSEGKLPGAGPAYFTKLIYFLLPAEIRAKHAGYIMDQWASCSINLLTGREVVLMDQIGHWVKSKRQTQAPLQKRWTYVVSDLNTADNYEAFCGTMDTLGKALGLTPDETDRLVLSDARPKPAEWRQHVIDHRRVDWR